MKDERGHRRDPRSYRQCQEFPLLLADNSIVAFNRREVPDRRTNRVEVNEFAKSARRQVPDRRINNIEVEWIELGSVLST